MNSEQIKAVLLSGDFAPVPAKFAYDYILALEAERDAWTKWATDLQRDTISAAISGRMATVNNKLTDVVIAARARVDSFKPKEATDATADDK